MCLILFAYDCHPRYQLVVASNRDEFYKRSTAPAEFWQGNSGILAGKDLEQGGTWMGVTTAGRFAALTNYRDPASYKAQAPSRGSLVQNYLSSHLDPAAYIQKLPEGAEEYNGFNLLAGTMESMYYYSNREKQLRKIEKGIHGLSNSLLDVAWPKVTRGKKALADCLRQEEVDAADLFAILADREQPPDQDLPSTGVSLEMERILAPLYVVSPNYGTRSSTVILIDRDDQVQYWERSYAPEPSGPWNEVHFTFKIE